MTETTTPAGWYRDTQSPGQMRYWDGTAWTAHVAPITGAPGPGAAPGAAPGATPAKGRSGATVALIIVGVVLGALMIIGLLAAIAIPIFLSQRSEAQVAAARADAAALSSEVAAYAVENMSMPAVEWDGANYLVGTPDWGFVTLPASEGVTLADFATDGVDFCIATTADATTVHYSSLGGMADGPCP
ncbi:DUF2510 domain-containing protein [Demequina sp. NBRC 110051]|uniref:DUF2510 domain-containing protein n=1 Tax=Demequina sp. NBRC 110051 TaxID=1570340 RepID=UPI000A00AEDD|nr:DUF2510 domain-containing protein [Demequina sp. NBRC 110051]